MTILNESVLLGLASVITAVSGLVWAFRRKS